MKKIKNMLGLALTLLLLGFFPSTAAAESTSIEVERIQGGDRFQTAVEISKETYEQAEVAVVASGHDFADALSGGQLAVAAEAPILLTWKTELNPDTKAELLRLKVKKIYLLGGELAISKKVENELKQIAEVVRLGIGSRYDTSKLIAEEARKLGMTDDLLVASGKDFPDGLTGGGRIAEKKATMALSDGKTLPDLKADSVTVLGGKEALPLPGYKGERMYGTTRFLTALDIAKKTFDKPKTAILVNGSKYPDALTAISLAKEHNAPILLTYRDSMERETMKYIEENCDKVIIAGGPLAVSNHVENLLKSTQRITVTFDPNYESPFPPTPEVLTLVKGSTATPKEILRTGYNFLGWYDNKEGTGDPVDLKTKTFDEDTTLYAKWEGDEIKVTFNWNFEGAPDPEIVTTLRGHTAAPTKPVTRSGYRFTGWAGNPEGTGNIVEDPTKIIFAEDVTLFAVWTKEITVSFELNGEGAAGKPEDQIILKGGKANEPKHPTREGFLFDGWYDNADGTGEPVDLKTKTFDADTTLYAKWAESVTVTFDLASPEAEPHARVTIVKGTKVPSDSLPKDPEREGENFIGWYTTPAAMGEEGEKIDFTEKTFDVDTTVYARWEPMDETGPVVPDPTT